MISRRLRFQLVAGMCATLCAGALAALHAQGPPGRAGQAAGRGAASSLFPLLDKNQDGSLTRSELKAVFASWLADADTGKTGAITAEQLGGVLNAALPRPAGFAGRGPQPQTPEPQDVQKMMAALPDKAPARPLHPRKVLVLCKANGFVHSSIPLAAKTVEALGTKTGAWTTTVTYDAADINAQNLEQYDLVFLDSTTGAFLDDPNDASATEARKKALLEFVRSGKGLAGIHAATDSYHQASGGRGGFGPGTTLAMQMVSAGDQDHDQKLNWQELNALADSWFDHLDPQKTGKVSRQDFTARFAALLPPGGRGTTGRQGRDAQVGTWPEFNQMIGGFFKFHWVYPQLITVKIDDPKSPLTAMFHNEEFQIHDETYTFGMDTWSRRKLHVLTSIDYAKMSDADKAREDYPRADHDYGLSWIHREGRGRVFYEAHGHDESIYAIRPMLEHVLAGVQYALGDLKADDSPSVK